MPCEQIIMMGDDATGLCQHLKIQTVQKDISPNECDGREERGGTQDKCVEADVKDVFKISVQVDEYLLQLFNI